MLSRRLFLVQLMLGACCGMLLTGRVHVIGKRLSTRLWRELKSAAVNNFCKFLQGGDKGSALQRFLAFFLLLRIEILHVIARRLYACSRRCLESAVFCNSGELLPEGWRAARCCACLYVPLLTGMRFGLERLLSPSPFRRVSCVPLRPLSPHHHLKSSSFYGVLFLSQLGSFDVISPISHARP